MKKVYLVQKQFGVTKLKTLFKPQIKLPENIPMKLTSQVTKKMNFHNKKFQKNLKKKKIKFRLKTLIQKEFFKVFKKKINKIKLNKKTKTKNKKKIEILLLVLKLKLKIYLEVKENHQQKNKYKFKEEEKSEEQITKLEQK